MTNINDEVLQKFTEATQAKGVSRELLERLVAELTAGGGNADRLAELIKDAAGDRA